MLVSLPLEPGLHDGNEGVGKEERGRHGKAHRQGEGYEHGAGDPCHEKRWGEDGENREHDEKEGNDDFLTCIENGTCPGLLVREVTVDVLDDDDGLVDQNADGEREPAASHEVDGLSRA